jgi:hypothetical protein
MEAPKAYLAIMGSRIYNEKSGGGDPVLLLHGGLGTVKDFAKPTPELAKVYGRPPRHPEWAEKKLSPRPSNKPHISSRERDRPSFLRDKR